MIFYDYYLKFSSRDEALDVLKEFVVDGELCGDISDIGTIYKGTGVILTDSEGFEYEETIPLDGYHVNIRLQYEKDFGTYTTNPKTPARIFA